MNLVDRATKIMTSPQTEWQVINGESTDTATLYKTYIMPLAAIGPVASLIGMSLIGVAGWRAPLLSALASAIVQYALVLASVLIIARIVDALAPSFGAKPDSGQSIKLVAFAGTSGWLGGIFWLVPALAVIGVLFSLYSLYLLYLGVPVLMKAPAQRSLAYTAVIVVVAVVVMLVIGGVVGALAPQPVGMFRG